ncbi:MAG: ABC transporter ATP-binding protein [Rhizobiales bacterium]|nr:ABC transporter ATP-binding protein [Hyphomicrobiales bacterium]
MSDILTIDRLSVAYGHVEAVTDVSLRVQAGEIVTVIGANGAGKSTLLNATLGLLPSRGKIRFDGRDMATIEAEDRVGLGLCLVAEKRELFGTMTVEDNLVLGGFRVDRRISADTLAAVFDRFPRLKERRTQLAGTLSGGERQMLAMGRALMSRPRLLMLDEPSLGLAPRIVADIFTVIADLRATGVAILLVEQNARAALNAADRAYVMELGRISLEGPSAELARDPRIAESYLGLGH